MNMRAHRTTTRSGSATVHAQETRPAAVKAGAKIREHKLKNGLTVLLAERHLDPVVAVMLWYKVGARDENEHEAGVSHFLEHMMFKGTPRFGKGEVDRATTILGGSNNAFTTPDHTAYWFELASDRWEKALEIEADRMKSLLLDPTEFEAEKAVVLEELAMGDDDPWRSLGQEMQALLFPRHPYRRPVIGYPDTLKAMTPADMRDYYTRFYEPDNAILVIAGDIDPESALQRVKAHFGPIRSASDPSRRPSSHELASRGAAHIESTTVGASISSASKPPAKASIEAYRAPQLEPKGERRLSIAWDDNGSRLCMAWPTVVIGTDDDFALDLVSTLLSGGRMSRLHRKLVLERGLATSVSTHNDTRIDTGVFWLHAECAQGVDPKKLESAIEAEIDLLAREPAGTAELERAKKILAAGEAHDSETVSDLAEDLGEFAADASWRMALETVERIRGVSAKAVRDCVARLLRKDRRVVGWCLPRAKTKAEWKTSKRRAAAGSKTQSSISSIAAKTRSSRARPDKRTSRATNRKSPRPRLRARSGGAA
jgi:zinc protease